MKRAAILCASLALAACGSNMKPPPEIRTVTVNVPVPVTCVPASANTAPDFKVSLSAFRGAATPEERYRLAAAGFLEREAWAQEAVAVLRGCRD